MLQENKLEIEQSEDFSKLPNYDKAYKQGKDFLSEAIITLDK
jgi:hypothetical protein